MIYLSVPVCVCVGEGSCVLLGNLLTMVHVSIINNLIYSRERE